MLTVTSCSWLLLLLLSADRCPEGQLPALAAAHPEAYCALIDCCVRSPLLRAEDAVAAAEVLQPAFGVLLGGEAALSNTTAVAGLAFALTSLSK